MHQKTNIFRMIFSVLLCLLLLFNLSACMNNAEPLEISDGYCTVPGENLRFAIPEDSFVFSQTTSVFSGDWELAGITDPMSQVEEYQDMGTLAHVASMGGKCNIFITKKQSSMAADIFNLTQADESALEAVIEDLNSVNETEGFDAEVSDTLVNDLRYATADIRYTPEEGQGEFMHEFCYVTIINGASYTFDAYSFGDELTQEELDYVSSFINGVEFTLILSNDVEPMSPTEILIAVLPLILVVALIVFLIVFASRRKKKMQRDKNELTEKLSEYRSRKKREKEENPDLPEPKTLFVNKTIHTDATLHQFSNFHAYKKHLLMLPGYALTGLAAIALGISLLGGDNFIWGILFLAAGIYCIVKIFTLPGSTYKVLQRVYKNLPNRVALYAFRDEDFRISGLQATGVFPYFQLSGVYETKDKFYLYFGEDNAYFVDKSTFSYGDVNEFRNFIKERMGKKFKRRMF